MIESMERLSENLEKLERYLPLLTQSQPDGNSSNSTINVNGGGWINSIILVIIGALALAMFIMYLSDRQAAARERDDFKAQSRIDIQRLDGDLKELKQKDETQQAYINEIYRSLKKQ